MGARADHDLKAQLWIATARIGKHKAGNTKQQHETICKKSADHMHDLGCHFIFRKGQKAAAPPNWQGRLFVTKQRGLMPLQQQPELWRYLF